MPTEVGNVLLDLKYLRDLPNDPAIYPKAPLAMRAYEYLLVIIRSGMHCRFQPGEILSAILNDIDDVSILGFVYHERKRKGNNILPELRRNDSVSRFPGWANQTVSQLQQLR